MLCRGVLAAVRSRAPCASLLPSSVLGPVAQSKRLGRLPIVPDPDLKHGSESGALQRIQQDEERQDLPDIFPTSPATRGALIVRRHNSPMRAHGSMLPLQAYPAHPHNFTPLRALEPNFSAMDRAVRDRASESRFDLVERRITPRYMGEGMGTPRRELQDGLVGGVRVRPVQNPYVRLKAAQRYRLNAWPSKNWTKWTPLHTGIRGSRRKYRMPQDLQPYKDELGEWHPPRVSGRYKADIEKQYYMNSLPWVWNKDFYQDKQHHMDREPRGPKRWYKREYRKAQVAAALRNADALVEEYRKERREAKRLSWIESMVLEFVGDQNAAEYVRKQKRVKK